MIEDLHLTWFLQKIPQDHHCLWINNCVGFRNYKAFFILVFYATFGMMYSTVCSFCSFSVLLKQHNFIILPQLLKDFSCAQVIIVSCAFQKDWDSDRRVLLKAFYVSGSFYFLIYFYPDNLLVCVDLAFNWASDLELYFSSNFSLAF